ncbi:biotin transporter BioY [Leucobacter sp. CSA1]|uniref:Biotin transporter BioY n=1 Tax=Leucobacter chromiisoli TaxID=2796471 RepID=A0A934UW19_9MICO|nr:biotin transporter BioY [Leucobacter chromiisoli]MBK0419808.1 biotin transporter BioY [Leucobacter chromiisoli]
MTQHDPATAPEASATAGPSAAGTSGSSAAGPAAEEAAPGTRPRRRSTATDIALIATFAALIAVCAILPAISVGGLVPITLQTFGVILAGAVLGARRGFLAVLLYLAVGAIGLPVFAGGSAGLAPFAGPSAGYLVAMPLAALLCGFIVERLPRTKVAASVPLVFAAGFVSSIVFIHPLGALGMSWLGGLTLQQAFIADLAFWPGDVVKNLLVGIVATAVHRAFPALLPRRR